MSIQRNVAIWVETDLRSTDDTAESRILRHAIGRIDVEYEGNTYKGNGELLSTGKILNTLQLKKTTLNLSYASTNLQILALFNEFKYRNRVVKVWTALRSPDGSINVSTTRQIFEGFLDSHTVDRSIIKVNALNIWSRFEQNAGARTSTGAQRYLIDNGVFNVPTNTEDKGFDFADKDYSGLVLGRVAAREVIHSQTIRTGGFFGFFQSKKTIRTTEHIPGKSGASFNDDGADYTRPIVFGRAAVRGNLIYAFNPTVALAEAAYPSFSSLTFTEGASEDTKFATFVYAVAEGEVSDITVVFPDVSGDGVSKKTIAMGNNSSKIIGIGNGTAIVAVEVKTGTYNQTSFQNVVNMDASGMWTSDHRCIGTALVAITIAAVDNFAGGIPAFQFICGGRKIRQITASNNLSSLEDVSYKNTSIDVFGLLSVLNGYSLTALTASYGQSESPAYAIMDILLNRSYGVGIPYTYINLQSFASSYANERKSGTPQLGDYITTCRGVFEGANTYREMLSSLLDTAKANLIWKDGQLHLLPNGYLGTDEETKADSSITTFDESNIIGGINRIVFAPSSRVYNTVSATAPVSNNADASSYQMTTTDANALAEDNYQKSELNITLPLAAVNLDADGLPSADSKEVIEEISRIRLRRSRFFIRGDFDVDFWDNTTLSQGEIIKISNKRYNLTGNGIILARVVDLTFNGLGQMNVKWVQYSNLIYDAASTDVTHLARTSFPTIPYNLPTTFSRTGPAGPIGPSATNTGSRGIRILTEPESMILLTNYLGATTGGSVSSQISIYNRDSLSYLTYDPTEAGGADTFRGTIVFQGGTDATIDDNGKVIVSASDENLNQITCNLEIHSKNGDEIISESARIQLNVIKILNPEQVIDLFVSPEVVSLEADFKRCC